MHVKLADESVCIGPPPARDSYLNIPAIVAACEITGADAVHPGYGFLAENARFADILEEHEITFIGPKAEHIRMMGDKIEAKRTAARLGIPCVPGSEGSLRDEGEARRIAGDIGYPVIVKAGAGGGGRGMKVARGPDELADAIASAKIEAKTAFGDDAVYLEKYLAKPRHIEVQVLGDTQGHAIHLGERDCSLQRRHQKVWEEGPSPALNPEQRDSIGGVVARAMAELGYVGAGTVEFLYEDGKFFFIEMNTRVQVEHPVTEMITGLTSSMSKSRSQPARPFPSRKTTFDSLAPRSNAESTPSIARTFVPSPGRITYFHPPGGLGIRVDSSAYQGYVIPPYYDSLVGKLIVHGRTRTEALMRLRRALDEFIVEGIETTLPLFRALVRNSDVQNGQYDIHWLEDFLRERGPGRDGYRQRDSS
jgi:acetyl-CoA carboxylase biotin carboxylase subunit